MPSCRCAHQLNAASVPSQAFMLSGLLLPSIRIHVGQNGFSFANFALSSFSGNVASSSAKSFGRHRNASSCSFASVHAQWIATSDEC